MMITLVVYGDHVITVKMRHCLILQNTHFDNLKWLLATLNKLI